eukprot:TRINITY_DN3159_c0_g1_i12.p1 TRINITY_DN3159_c0_g1~~TRINITY_DN3159_c0_g1_i12.p1  ORF type:complete len:381 (-),score=5.82 TRINITY_DN3159_c0_g1_i12:1065-2207(-)
MRVQLVFLLVQTLICCCSAHITIDWITAKKEASQVRRKRIAHEKKLAFSNSTNDKEQRISYTCYEPVEGLSKPIITIFGAMSWPSEEIEDFIRRNRLGYAKHQKLRYCELLGQADFGRTMNWQRDVFILAILPCTDYALYMDTDAIFFNKDYTLYPWVNYMDKENLDLLMTEDYYPGTPMNSGVFITRNSKWSYNYFRSFYNICACDKIRLGEWPFDQGPQYDLYMQNKNDHVYNAGQHIQLSKSQGLNEKWDHRRPLGNNHFIVHFVVCCPNHATGNVHDHSFPFKYEFIKEIYEYVMPNSTDSKINIDQEFTQHVNQCLPLIWKELTSKKDFSKETWGSSLIDFDLDRQGNIERVEAKGIQCIESSEHKCSLRQYWLM